MMSDRQRLLKYTLMVCATWFCIVALLPANADNPESPSCKYCEFNYQPNASITFGLSYLGENSDRYARYSGLSDEGARPVLSGEYLSRSEQGNFFALAVDDLGLDSSQTELNMGKQSAYAVEFSLREMKQVDRLSAPTLYEGIDSGRLQLPTGWVTGESTQSLSMLDASVQETQIATLRRITQLSIDGLLGIADLLNNAWQYDVELRRNEQSGQQLLGASFLTSSVLLPAPREFVTDSFETSISHYQDQWTTRIRYFYSSFSNQKAAFTWENPYTAMIPGTEVGRISLEPDNDFQQLSTFMVYQPWMATAFTLDMAVGAARQDESFIASSINNLLAPAPLSRDSLGGEVDTRHLRLEVQSTVNRRWSLQASYRYDERDNKTRAMAVRQVVTDSYLAEEETSVPYGFEKKVMQASAAYRPVSRWTVKSGVKKRDDQRRYQSIDDTDVNNYWLESSIRFNRFVDWRVWIENSQRNGSSRYFSAEEPAEENTRLRRFHVADLDQTQWRYVLGVYPVAWCNVSYTHTVQLEDYPNSSIGLQNGESRSHVLDAVFMPSHVISVGVSTVIEKIESTQSGSQAFSSADWFAQNTDLNRSVGFNAQYQTENKKWQMKGELYYASYTGETDVDTLSNQAAFPDFQSRLKRANVSASYQLNSQISTSVDYIYESYHLNDWQISDISVPAAPRLITAGGVDPHYTTSVLLTSLRIHY